MLIPLSPMDYYFLRRSLYTIQFIFPFDGKIDEQKLRDAAFHALQSFPALRAELIRPSKTETMLRVPETFGPDNVFLRSKNLSENDLSSLIDPVITAPGEPLLKMTLGYTRSKTYFGVSLSHLVGDGNSLFQFLAAISHAFQGRPITAPSNQRELLSAGLPKLSRNVDLKRLFDETGYIRPRPLAPMKTKRETVLYTKERLQELKKEARSEEQGLTSNDIIMADLLRRFYSSIPVQEDRLMVRCPVDYRQIHPELARLETPYFGNAVRDAVAVFDRETFPQLPLSDIAFRIRKAIRGIDATEVLRSLSCLRDLRMQDGADVFEELGCPGLLVSNLSKMPLHKMDYGCGTPHTLIHASLNPRLAAVLPHPEGVEVSVQLPVF